MTATPSPDSASFGRAGIAVGLYVAISIATLIAVGMLSHLAPTQATSEAWGHAIIVAVVAFVLPLRFRAASRGSQSALRATMVIAVVIGIVNLVEALIPDAFPIWMRWDMATVAALMGALVFLLPRKT